MPSPGTFPRPTLRSKHIGDSARAGGGRQVEDNMVRSRQRAVPHTGWGYWGVCSLTYDSRKKKMRRNGTPGAGGVNGWAGGCGGGPCPM